MIAPEIAPRMIERRRKAGSGVRRRNGILLAVVAVMTGKCQVIRFIAAAKARRMNMIDRERIQGELFRGLAVFAAPVRPCCNLSP